MPAKKKDQWMLWKTPDGVVRQSATSGIYDKTTSKWTTAKELGAVLVPATECEFIGALKLIQFHHGRSCHFYFVDIQTNHEYMMQGTEMEKILFNHTLYQGVICGRWGWVNRGGIISIKLLEELDDVEASSPSSS